MRLALNVIAKDEKAAAIKAVTDNKGKITTDLSQVEALVRPFGTVS